MSAGYGAWRALGPRPHDTDSEARLSRAVVARCWRLTDPYRGRVAGLAASVVATAVLAAVPPLLYRAVIDDALANRDRRLLNLLAVAILVVAVGAALTNVAARWFSSRLGEDVIFDLRVALFDHIQRLPFAFFTRTQTGALISRMTSDLRGGHRVFSETLASVASTALSVVVTLAVMFVLDWRLTLLALVIAPLFMVVARRMRGRLHHLMSSRASADATLSAQMGERFQVGGALLVKLFGRRDQERDAFAGKAAEVRDLGVHVAVASRVFHVGFTLVAAVGVGAVYWIGGRLVISEAVTVGTLVAFTAYLAQLYGPLTATANARVDLANALVSFSRVFEVLDFPTVIAERDGAIEVTDPVGHVRFQGVWFRYPRAADVTLPSLVADHADQVDDEPAWVLRDVSFEIAPGRTVALVGPSGAGKTTVSMLVPRLYEAVRGTVEFDGHDVGDLTLGSLARNVGMVVQDTHLFHDTVRNNLRYARPDAGDADLVEAAKAARIHDLVASLPDGYDTLVGERGYRFSGGEKQRLAIARLLLQDPAVAILDEATAHLDSEAERLIQQALAEALAGRSSLVIAHRLSTVVNADLLLVMQEGRIVERGTHDELLASGGLYAELYRIQFAAPAAPPRPGPGASWSRGLAP